jgi:electron-transferring-flavoprotein dehydrogenase
VIEKASTIGAHILSGAVIEPGPLDELLPGWRDNPPPICVPATEDEFWLLTKTGGYKLPVPPQMHNHGNFIVSLGAMCAWLAPQAEALGVEIYPGFAAAETLHDADGRVVGVRIGDMGVAKDGSHKPGYTQGIDIRAKVTVLAEGARGHLTKRLVKQFGSMPTATRRPIRSASRSCGRCRKARVSPARSCTRSAGRPTPHLRRQLPLPPRQGPHRAGLRLGPRLPPTRTTSPTRPSSSGSTTRRSSRCSRAANPLGRRARDRHRRLAVAAQGEMPGAMLIGDTAGLLNVPKIKGTHQAMRSGMLAAEHLAAPDGAGGLRREAARLAVMAELRRSATSSPASRRACGSACSTRHGRPRPAAPRRGR